LRAAPSSLLAVDEDADGVSGRLATSFELSYRQLTQECQFVLRRLGLAPVPHISVEVAAALTGLSTATVGAHLRQLHTEALAGEDEHGYYLHDLIRDYAKGLAGADDPAENTRAVDRVLVYYHAAATYIDSLLTRQPPPPVLELPPPAMNHHFTDDDSAISWAQAELNNFQACADYAIKNADDGTWGREEKAWTIRFSAALAGLLRNEGLWPRSIELQTRAIAAARQLTELLAEANALHERALLYRLSSKLADARADLERALEIYRDIGGDAGGTGEAHVLNTYGVVLDQLGEPAESQNRLGASLACYRRLGDQLGEANVLNDLGMAEYFADRFTEAADLIGQALQLYRVVDHPLGKAHAHSNLAKAQRRVGLGHEATDNLEAARALYRQLGNKLGAASARAERGAVLRQQEDYDKAERFLDKAAKRLEQVGNYQALAKTLEEWGDLYIAKGDPKKAKILLMRALELYREHNIPRDLTGLLKKLE